MTAYIISDVGAVAPEDQAAWKAYLAAAPAAIAKYGGRYLARGGAIDVLEGDWSPHAIVIVAFPDRDAAMAWYASPEYAEALKGREGTGLTRQLICVEGAEDASADKLLGCGTASLRAQRSNPGATGKILDDRVRPPGLLASGSQ